MGICSAEMCDRCGSILEGVDWAQQKIVDLLRVINEDQNYLINKNLKSIHRRNI